MKKLTNLLQKIKNNFTAGKCPKCGDWLGDDEEVCQTCGYPWSD